MQNNNQYQYIRKRRSRMAATAATESTGPGEISNADNKTVVSIISSSMNSPMGNTSFESGEQLSEIKENQRDRTTSVKAPELMEKSDLPERKLTEEAQDGVENTVMTSINTADKPTEKKINTPNAVKKSDVVQATDVKTIIDMLPGSYERFCQARSVFAGNKSNTESHFNIIEDVQPVNKELRMYRGSNEGENDLQDSMQENEPWSYLSTGKMEPVVKERRRSYSVFGGAWKAIKGVERRNSKVSTVPKIKSKQGKEVALPPESADTLVMRLINMLSVDNREIKERNCIEALPILTDLLKILQKE